MRGTVVPCVVAQSGHPTNFHRSKNSQWGEVLTDRVTPAEATCFIVTVPGYGTQVEIV